MSLVNALDSQLLKWRALIWSPDDLMTVLKRYLRESNESEMGRSLPNWHKSSPP